MKKDSKPVPNQRLREEREIRGWSQKYVTEQIGVDPYYLSRWERGTATPSPHYRQKLCALFGKNAKELGLLQDERGIGSEQMPGEVPVEGVSQAKGLSLPAALSALPASKTMLRDPAIPLPSAEITQLVGRDDVFSQLKARLCSGNASLSTAINGLPGVGKTALVTALVHDPEISNHFRDGILWSGLGPQPDILALLSRWARLLGIESTQVASLARIENLTTALRMATGMRRMLLVIDDAWYIDQGNPGTRKIRAGEDGHASGDQGHPENGYCQAHSHLQMVCEYHRRTLRKGAPGKTVASFVAWSSTATTMEV